MLHLHRRNVLAGASLAALLPFRSAGALGPSEAATLLGVTDAADFLRRKSEFLTMAPWGPAGDRLWAACLADEGNGVTAAIIQGDAGAETGRIVAGPVDADVLTIDPFWTLDLSISPPMPLGPDIPAFGVTVSNSYLSTGRSTYSMSMSIFLRRDSELRLVFSGYVSTGTSEVVPCRKPRPDGDPCREEQKSRWVIRTDGAAAPGKPPPLIVVERPSGRVVSRHVWRGDQYHPPTFEPRR
jgi:hypothetical protein